MKKMLDRFLRQSINRVNIFNYIYVIILICWMLLNQWQVNNQISISTWILVQAYIMYAVIYSILSSFWKDSIFTLKILSYLSYLINLSLVSYTVYLTSDLQSLFYLLLIPLIEFRHNFKRVGMISLGLLTVIVYIFVLHESSLFDTVNSWVTFIIGFVVFLIYTLHIIISISSSEIDQYLQREEAEQTSTKIQREKEVMELLYQNIQTLAKSLDVDHIAEELNKIFSTIAWQKRFILVTIHPGQYEYHLYAEEKDNEISEYERSFINNIITKRDLIYHQDICGIPLKVNGSMIGAVVLVDFSTDVLPNDFQLVYMICEQVSSILNNAMLFLERERETITDSMTKVYNKRGFMSGISHMISESPNNLYLAMYDIDHFKKFNDTYGHQFGDEVLIATTKLVNGALRENDFLARYGGEEFAILFEAQTDAFALSVAERLRQKVADCGIYNQDTQSNVSVTISIGLCKYQKNWSINHYIKIADKALYQSKTDGRNRVTLIGSTSDIIDPVS